MSSFQKLAILYAVFLLAVLLANERCARGEEANDKTVKRILLLGQSPDGHPRGTHEYMPGVRIIARCLDRVREIDATVVNADDPWSDGPKLLRGADGVVLFLSQGGKWIQDDDRRYEALTQLAQRGGGLAVLHWGMGTRDAKHIDGFLKLFGGCHGGPDRKYTVVEKAAVRIADTKHPIMTAIEQFQIREEFYYQLKFAKSKPGITPILQTQIDGNLETVAWAWDRGGGRSFGFSGGHFHENWRREEYRRMIAQAVLWTVKVPIPKEGLNVSVHDKLLSLPKSNKP